MKKKRIVYFGNNYNGYQILNYIVNRGDNLVGLVTHPKNKSKFRDDILRVANLPKSKIILDGSKIKKNAIVEKIKSFNPDIILSINFGYILQEELLNLPKYGSINLHTSYLPYNKGIYPNVFPIIDGTPAGVTIHFMDKGVDTGKILSRKKVPVSITDTGYTLYKKLEDASIQLFKNTWPRILKGKIKPIKQTIVNHKEHKLKEMDKVDKIDINKKYKAIELINLLRARTFPPFDGAYFMYKGKKIYFRLEPYEKEK